MSVINTFPWHQKTWQNFIQAREHKQIPHAILLSGEEGIGKFELATRMAKSLICMNPEVNDSAACNNCQSCKTFESGANPDFIQITLLEDKQQIGVDQIRALSEFLNYSRSYNTNRVVILNPAERMNLNAANSLLKSLEEPTAHTVIILVCSNINQLLPTIKSRCQLYSVATPSRVDSIQWLAKYQSDNKNNEIDPELLVDIVGMKPLKAIQLSEEDINNRKHYFQDLKAAIKHQITISEMAKKWEKHDFTHLLNWQIMLLQDNIKSGMANMQSTHIETNANLELTQHLSNEEHWLLYQNLIKQKQFIHTSVNPLMFMENMIMLWTKTI